MATKQRIQLFDAKGELVTTVETEKALTALITWAGRHFVFNGGRYVETDALKAQNSDKE